MNSLRGGNSVRTTANHYNDYRSDLMKNASFMRAIVAIPGCIKHKSLRHVMTSSSHTSSRGERRGDGVKMSSSGSKDDDAYESNYLSLIHISEPTRP